VLLALTLSAGTASATGAALGLESARSDLVAAGAGEWAWPLDEPHEIVRPFIAPATPYGSGHRGIDLAGAAGADVLAPADGIVHFSGFVVDRPVLSIDHGGGLVSSFEPVASDLVAGQVVHRGDRIGALQSGHCRAPCLHLGVRLHGQYVSPLLYLGGIPYPVLLPTRPLP
jgi:murein DD-endopeptidase MepM/ murein hydrolase activator NlpD